MKPTKLLFFFLTTVASILSHAAYAANEDGSVTNGTGIILRPDLGNNPVKRPKAPSRQIIECVYADGVLAIEFTVPEGICEVTLTEQISGAITRHTIDSSDLIAGIPVGAIYESFIEISTEYGNTYVGLLTSD